MPSPAVLVPNASPEWAALRVWAAAIRDNATLPEVARDNGKALCSLLDTCHDIRQRQPFLETALWDTALRFAEKMGYAHHNGDWREPPAVRNKEKP